MPPLSSHDAKKLRKWLFQWYETIVMILFHQYDLLRPRTQSGWQIQKDLVTGSPCPQIGSKPNDFLLCMYHGVVSNRLNQKNCIRIDSFSKPWRKDTKIGPFSVVTVCHFKKCPFLQAYIKVNSMHLAIYVDDSVKSSFCLLFWNLI